MIESKAKFKIWNPTTKKMYGPYTIREIANREWGEHYDDIEGQNEDVYAPTLSHELVFLQCE